MEKNDRIYLILINLLTQMMFVFFSIFFNIFVLSVSDDLNFVMGVNLFSLATITVIEFFLIKILNKKTSNILYKMSFILIFASILLAFFVTEQRLWIVWIIEIIYSFALMFYYVPHEIAVMGKTKDYSLKKFLGISTIVSSLSAVLSPLISGFIIGTWSYTIIFIFIALFALIAFILSFFIKNFYVDKSDLKLKDVFKLTHKDKKIRYVLFAYGAYKFSQDSVISLLLPLLLFMKVGSEFSVGLYSSLITLLSTVSLFVYILISAHKKEIMWGSSILIVLSSLLLILMPNFITFIIFYITKSGCAKIYSNGIYESTFAGIKNTTLANNKKEYHFIFSLYNHVLCMVAYGLAFLLYNLILNEISFSILILILSFVQLISAYFLILSDKTKHSELISLNN